MSLEIDHRQTNLIALLSRAAGIIDILIGTIGFLGAQFGRERIHQIFPGLPIITPQTAVCITIIGFSLLLRLSSPRRVRAFFSFAGAYLILSATYALAFPRSPEFTPSIAAAITFLLIGLYYVGKAFRKNVPAFVLLAATAIPFLSILVAPFRFLAIYGQSLLAPHLGMAIPSALALFVSGVALCEQAKQPGIICLLSAKSAAGTAARTLTAVALCVPLLFSVASYFVMETPREAESYTHFGLTVLLLGLFLGGALVTVWFLNRQEERYRALMENSFDSILIVDAQGKIEYANPQVKESFGYEPSELLGRPVEVLLPDALVASHVAARTRYLKNPKRRAMGTGLDLKLRRRDGSDLSVDISLTPVMLGSRRVVTAIVRDVTVRKCEEDRQRFLGESARVLTESYSYQDRVQKIAQLLVPELADFCVVYTKRRDQVEATAVAHRDPGMVSFLRETATLYPSVATQQLGGPPLEASSLRLDEISAEDYSKYAKSPDHLQRLRKIGATSYFTLPLIARNQVIGILSLGRVTRSARFRSYDNAFLMEIARRFAVAADQARLYEEAVEAVRGRDEILAIVSHDLKNPISTIQLAGQLIIYQVGTNPTSAAENAQRICRAAKRMNRLVAELLQFGKVQARAFSPQRVDFTVDSLFQDLANLFGPLAAEKQIALSFENISSTPVHADAELLSQALANLIGNAIKFTPEHGAIQVKRKLGKGLARFEVTDTGPGIPKGHQENIFGMFWRPEDSTADGAGLGLYIVRKVVDAHGGRVWVESEEGKGTTFVIEIPQEAGSTVTPIRPEPQVRYG